MLKQQARLIATLVFLVDLTLVGVAFVGAHMLRSALSPFLHGSESGFYPLAKYLPLLPLVLLIWGMLLWSSGRYRSHRRVPLVNEAAAVVRVCLFGVAIFGLALWIFRLDEVLLGADRISRAWILIFVVLTCLLLLAEKLALRVVARRLREKGLNYRTVLLVGTGATAAALADSLREHRWWGYRLLGSLRLDDGDEARNPDPRVEPVLGDLSSLDELLERQLVDEIVFAASPAEVSRWENLVLALQDRGIVVRFALELFPHAKERIHLEELDGVPLVSLASAPGPFALAFKRSVDVALALVIMALAFPVVALVAVAIQVSGGGAVFFRQRRCGLNGRVFTLYKFRTMVENAEDQMAEVAHLNEMKGPVFKASRDPRVTRLGRTLRKFSLDELPQLWNVLRGEMSLVGPRPPIPEEVARYAGWQRRRLAMKPGLTCLWQVSGRNQLDFDRWMALDLQYIDNWSLWLDFKILAKTVPVVFSGRGAS